MNVLSILLVATAVPSSFFSDHMMLQRDRPVPVWGTAAPGERVAVEFGGRCAASVTGKDGRWRVALPAFPASETGRDLLVRGVSGEQRFVDVIVGDVYLAAGQSNMQFPIYGRTARQHDHNGNALVQIVNDRGIRFSNPRRTWCDAPTNDVELAWGAGVRSDLTRYLYRGMHEEGSVSAVAYYFARYVREATGVPVGFVDVSRGGAFIEPCLAPAEAAKTKELNLHVFGPHQRPGVLWNGMIDPMKAFPFKGVLWYQGESNKCCTNGAYLVKFRALVRGWRREFANERLPFYFVQLAPCSSGHLSVQLQQAEYEREDPDSAMVVVTDVGSFRNIHPTDKNTVGLRLALRALKRDYGFSGIEDASPVPVGARRTPDGCVAVTFDHAEWMYVINDDMGLAADFEVKDADGGWRKATIVNFRETWVAYLKQNRKFGEIDGGSIVLSASGTKNPVAVRYLFNAPWKGSVFNGASLPLGPFEMDVMK